MSATCMYFNGSVKVKKEKQQSNGMKCFLTIEITLKSIDRTVVTSKYIDP